MPGAVGFAVLTFRLPVVAILRQHGSDFTEKGRFPCRVGSEIGLIRVLAVNTARRTPGPLPSAAAETATGEAATAAEGGVAARAVDVAGLGYGVAE